jgi:hypothetical protein
MKRESYRLALLKKSLRTALMSAISVEMSWELKNGSFTHLRY